MFSQPKIPHATESGNRKQFVLVMHYVIAVIIIISIIIIIAIIIIISVPWKSSCTGAIIAIPWFVSSSANFVLTVLTETANVTILLSVSANDE